MVTVAKTKNDLEKEKFDDSISTLELEYQSKGEPIEVSFRKLIPDLNTADRATHLIHSYPAKLLVHIPHFFLNNSKYSSENDTILDPFCGSGTVLLESILANRNCIGTDINPLAVLVSKVKTTNLDSKLIIEYLKDINSKFAKIRSFTVPDVVNIDYWYSESTKKDLSKLRVIIDKISDENYRLYFLVCLSVCARKTSFADPRVSVPVKLKASRGDKVDGNILNLLLKLENTTVIVKFNETAHSNMKRMQNLNFLKTGNSSANIILKNAKDSFNETGDKFIKNDSIDLVVTSPPYAGAQKYIRASSLNLGWTGLSNVSDLQKLNQESIGRESYKKEEYKKFTETNVHTANEILIDIYKEYPLRAHIAGNYLNEMQLAFKQIYDVLKKDKYFILIAANNQVCGKEFLTQNYLKEMARKLGFSIEMELIDEIHSYGLMTKRNKTASIITREWITVFKK